MTRRVLRALLALAAVIAVCAPAAGAAGNTWAGVWDTDFGRMTLDAGGSGAYEGFSPGTVSGHVTGDVNEGTWHQPGDPPKNGTFKFTLGSTGQSFTGEWAYDSGGCGSACGWQGTCIEGPCLKNGTATGCIAAARRAQSADPCLTVTPRSVRPELGEMTSYKAPAAGKVAALPMPELEPQAKGAVVDIASTDASGDSRPVPPVLGVELTRANEQADQHEDRGLHALELCYILVLGEDAGEQNYFGCVEAILKVLKRNDEIQARKRGKPVRAARAARCRSVKLKRPGKRLRAAARVSCKATAAGVRLSFRRRPGGASLSSLFGRKAALVVGRSRFDKPAARGDRVNVTWRAN